MIARLVYLVIAALVIVTLVVTAKRDVHIEPETLLITKSGTAASPHIVDGGGRAVNCIQIKADYVTVRNFMVDGCFSHAIWTASKHVTIENNVVRRSIVQNGHGPCSAAESWGSGIKVAKGGSDVIIKGNRVYENCGEGIAVTRGSNVILDRNTVYDNFSVNIYVDNSHGVLVKNNRVSCGNSDYYRNGSPAVGILLGAEYYSGWGYQLHDVTVRDNYVESCGPIRLYEEEIGEPRNIVINKNVFKRVRQPAVHVKNANADDSNVVIP